MTRNVCWWLYAGISFLVLFLGIGSQAWAAAEHKILAPEFGISFADYETSKISSHFNDFSGTLPAVGLSVMTLKPSNWAWGMKILSTQGKDDEQTLQLWSLGLLAGYKFGSTFYFFPSLIAGMSFVTFTNHIRDTETENVETAYAYNGRGFFLGPRQAIGVMITNNFSINVWGQYQYHVPNISDSGMEAFDNAYVGVGLASTF